MKMYRLIARVLVCALLLLAICFPAEAFPAADGADVSEAAASESMVLLKNESDALPLTAQDKIALFGEGQVCTDGKTGGFYLMGRGSGYFTLTETLKSPCDVFASYVSAGKLGGVYAPLTNAYKAAAVTGESFTYSPTDAEYIAAAEYADKAVFFLSRSSAEGSDIPAANFGLTASERAVLQKICKAFDGKPVIVVLNLGGVINCGFALGREEGLYADAVITAPYMGIRGVDVLCKTLIGEINPSGKTADTYAKALTDYPSYRGFYENANYVTYDEDIYVGYRYFETFDVEVDYPFGYGLSYTTFAMSDYTYAETGDTITVSVTVTNTGNVAGKEVAQVYFAAPQKGTDGALLSKSAKELCAFAKTDLLAPGASQKLTLDFSIDSMASYDDLGTTGYKSAYVLEAGDYTVYVGNSVKNVIVVGRHHESELRVVEQLSELCEPTVAFNRLTFDGSETVGASSTDRTAELLPPVTTAKRTYPASPITAADVLAGDATVGEFLAQMSDEELVDLSVMTMASGAGTTGGWGGSPETAEKYRIPIADTADGPAGLRIVSKGTGIPGATALACSWNTDLLALLGEMVAREALLSGVDVWLSPGVNIHRFPLCGRNFEYFSEDPYLTGVLASELIRAVEENGVATMVKHFVANEKEYRRSDCDSRVSERALREIYLAPFRMSVDAGVSAVMTSYNYLNGEETAENTELLRGILRGEWGFTGVVGTDWSNNTDHAKEVLAGNNIYNSTKRDLLAEKMDLLQNAVACGSVSRSQLLENAEYILNTILKLPKADLLADPSVHTVYAAGESKIEAEDFFYKHGYARLEKSGSRTYYAYGTSTGGYDPYVMYKLDVERAGSYILRAAVANASSLPNYDALTVYVNGEKQEMTYSAATTGSWSSFAFRAIGKVELPAGEVEIKIQTNTGRAPGNIDYFVFNPIEEVYTPISTAEELLALMNDPEGWGGKYYLTADIDLSAYTGDLAQGPIGTNAANFTGIFDGMGHTISGVSLSSATEPDFALFGKIKGAVVRDLTVRGEVSSTYPGAVLGGIVGTLDPDSMVSGCKNYATVTHENTTKAGKGIGGVVGYVYSGSAKVGTVVKFCQNYGAVSANTGTKETVAGGVIGCLRNAGAGWSYAYALENYGDVRGSNIKVGGIIGHMTQSEAGGGNTLDASVNYGSVTSGAGRSGGIVGYSYSVSKTDGNQPVISRSANYGSVHGATGYELAGVCGFLVVGDVTDCIHLGSVTADNDIAPAGIVGRTYTTTNTLRSAISGCYTADDAEVVGTLDSEAYVSIENCGKVSAADLLAGAVDLDGYTLTAGGPIPSVLTAPVLRGDMDGDGSVDLHDVLLLLKAVINKDKTINHLAADINGDGNVSLLDVLILLKNVVE